MRPRRERCGEGRGVSQRGHDAPEEHRGGEHDEDRVQPRHRPDGDDVAVADCGHGHEHPVHVLDVHVAPSGERILGECPGHVGRHNAAAPQRAPVVRAWGVCSKEAMNYDGRVVKQGRQDGSSQAAAS